MKPYEAEIADSDGKVHKVKVIDTNRSLSEALEKWVYPDTNVFMLCYSVIGRDTFDYLKTFFVKNTRRNMDESVPLILVGTKLELAPVKSDFYVTPEEAEALAVEIGAAGSIQCSAFAQAKTNIGNVDIAFNLALEAALEHQRRQAARTNRLGCCILT